jgi:hypothetical protein
MTQRKFYLQLTSERKPGFRLLLRRTEDRNTRTWLFVEESPPSPSPACPIITVFRSLPRNGCLRVIRYCPHPALSSFRYDVPVGGQHRYLPFTQDPLLRVPVPEPTNSLVGRVPAWRSGGRVFDSRLRQLSFFHRSSGDDSSLRGFASK